MNTAAVTKTHRAEPIIGSELSRSWDSALYAECKHCGETVQYVVVGGWDGEKASAYWRHSR